MESAPDTVDRAELTRVVGVALQREAAQLDNWAVEPITYDATNPVSGGVYRLRGTATDRGETVGWSLVLKIVRRPSGLESRPGYWPSVFLREPEADSPPMYWKREVLAYRSGLLDHLPGGLAAPRCFAVVERSASVFWLWLEDVADVYGGQWTPERYAVAARHLGRFNGGSLARGSLPYEPWLRQGWMRSWLDHVAREGGMDRIVADVRSLPSVREVFPRSMADRLCRLWAEREEFLAALDRLPRTLCHRDAFPANLLITGRTAAGEEEIVAVDWAFVGIGPLGEDVAPLIAVQPPGEMGAAGTRELRERVLDGYVRGLREAGWEGEEVVPRAGYAASLALRYGCLTAAVALLNMLDPGLVREMERRRGLSLEAIMEGEVEKFDFYLAVADEARDLIERM